MSIFGASVLFIIILLIVIHISSLKLATHDQVLCYYFILICIIDIFLNHIHDRILT